LWPKLFLSWPRILLELSGDSLLLVLTILIDQGLYSPASQTAHSVPRLGCVVSLLKKVHAKKHRLISKALYRCLIRYVAQFPQTPTAKPVVFIERTIFVDMRMNSDEI
jgi:hypothetical protein